MRTRPEGFAQSCALIASVCSECDWGISPGLNIPRRQKNASGMGMNAPRAWHANNQPRSLTSLPPACRTTTWIAETHQFILSEISLSCHADESNRAGGQSHLFPGDRTWGHPVCPAFPNALRSQTLLPHTIMDPLPAGAAPLCRRDGIHAPGDPAVVSFYSILQSDVVRCWTCKVWSASAAWWSKLGAP